MGACTPERTTQSLQDFLVDSEEEAEEVAGRRPCWPVRLLVGVGLSARSLGLSQRPGFRSQLTLCTSTG